MTYAIHPGLVMSETQEQYEARAQALAQLYGVTNYIAWPIHSSQSLPFENYVHLYPDPTEQYLLP